MSLFREVVLTLHLLGFGALFGGAVVQVSDRLKVVNAAMLYGALLQVITGLLLVGIIEGQDDDVNHAKVGAKLAVALVVALLCWVNRARRSIPRGVFGLILLLTATNVVVSVFW